MANSGDSWFLDSVPSARFPVYTRLNANDVLADPITPLGASLMWHPHVFPGWANSYASGGAFELAELAGDAASVGAFFYGHLYINMTTARMVGVRAGLTAELVDNMWFAGGGTPPPHVPHPDDENPKVSAQMVERAGWALSTTTFPELEEERQLADRLRAERPDLASLTSAALVARARSVAPLERFAWRGYAVATNFASIGPSVLGGLLGAADPTLTIRLVGSSGDVDSAAPSLALWELSRAVRAEAGIGAQFDAGLDGLQQRLFEHQPQFAARLQAFLRDFGARGPNEWDLGSPSWETHPRLMLSLLDRLRQEDDERNPAVRQRTHQADAEQAMAQALAIVGDDATARATMESALASARRFASWRERGKTTCVRILHEARVALFEMGRRLEAQGVLDAAEQIYMAVDDELDVLCLDPAVVADTIKARHKEWLGLFDLDLPPFLDGTKPIPPLSGLRRRTRNESPITVGEVLQGNGASPGVARGRARVVRSVAEIEAFEPGEVLVAPQTDPSWTPLFLVAAAAVVDVGAMGSHAMIVSRELGIPCAAGVLMASHRITDGAMLEVDGSAGTVTVLAL